MAEIGEFRGLAGETSHLHALTGGYEYGGICAGAGRQTPIQPDAGSQERQGAAH